jgi:hypothetical protein
MKKVIGIVLVIVAVLLWRFLVGPALQVTATNAIGNGWDDAKPEFTRQMQAALLESFADFELPADTRTQISECIAGKSVEFLNTTDCSYLYNKATSSEADHLADQAACMQKVGYEKKEEAFSLDCLKQLLPDDWKHLRKTLVAVFTALRTKGGAGAAQAKTQAVCIVDKTIAMANQRKCPFVNRAAEKAQDLINGLDDCIGGADKDPEYLAIFAACIAPPAGEPG